MSNSTTREVAFRVQAADQATELFVIDGQFNLVARGVGRLVANLVPGIYKVKARTGTGVEERHVVHKPGGGARVSFDPIPFASAAPLAQTAKADKSHMAVAAKQSRAPAADIGRGEGSSIFVFARHLPGATDPGPVAHPARGLSLAGPDDALAADLGDPNGRLGATGGGPAPWAAYHLRVAPGPYLLRLESPAGRLEQTLVATAGWQTQVFLTQRAYDPARPGLLPDLPGASILLAREGQGFDPASPQNRLVELARLGLSGGRDILPDREIDAILGAKFDNPMLGLFGAHILLRREPAPGALLRQVVENLWRVLGKLTHPDVEALAVRLDHRRSAYTFRTPPMLRASWSMVIDATVRNPGLVPPDSLAARAGTGIWREGPWLIWTQSGDGHGRAGAEAASRRGQTIEYYRSLIAKQFPELVAGPPAAAPKAPGGKKKPAPAGKPAARPAAKAAAKKAEILKQIAAGHAKKAFAPPTFGAQKKDRPKKAAAEVFKPVSKKPKTATSPSSYHRTMKKLVRLSGMPRAAIESMLGFV